MEGPALVIGDPGGSVGAGTQDGATRVFAMDWLWTRTSPPFRTSVFLVV
jgi:hypothetical protein